MTSALISDEQLTAGPRRGRPRRIPAIVVRPAPRREPPFDDERDDWNAYEAGPFDQRLPFRRDRPATPAQRRIDPADALPDPAAWGRRLLTGIIEAANGLRPTHQLSPMLSRTVTMALGNDLDAMAQNGRNHWARGARIRSVHASRPCPGVAEFNATFSSGRRVRAIAMRLEVRHDRWRCTRMQLG